MEKYWERDVGALRLNMWIRNSRNSSCTSRCYRSLGNMRIPQPAKDAIWQAVLKKEYCQRMQHVVGEASASGSLMVPFGYKPLLASLEVADVEQRKLAAEVLPLVKEEHDRRIAEKVTIEWERMQENICQLPLAPSTRAELYANCLQERYYAIVAEIVRAPLCLSDKAGDDIAGVEEQTNAIP